MPPETKTCANYKVQFAIPTEDFDFYTRIDVPPPTWCPMCRMIRRQMFRNERALYKRNCDLCGTSVVSMYAPGKPFQVYCTECYSSDKWDPLSFGREYDFGKSFFAQFAELMNVVPRRALYQDFVTNSEYASWSVYAKNSYLIFGGHHYEDCNYASQCFYVTNCTDVDFCQKSESCYRSVHLRQCNRVHFSLYSEDCTDSWFLYGCRNCHDCIGCVNLRNASYCIFNERYSKEEYERKVQELELNSYAGLQALRRSAREYSLKFPRKYAWVRNVVDSTGDDLEEVKNCHFCFSAAEAEDCKYSFFIPTEAKDAYDVDHVGIGAELVDELVSGFGVQRVAFGSRVYYSHDIWYGDDCYNSANLFGCIGIRKKEYAILNMQYPKEEYAKLIPKVIQHMNDKPYVDKAGRVYTFGEFFPPDLSPFAYNETVAQEYFPVTKGEAAKKGYAWRDAEAKHYAVTLEATTMPDKADDVPRTITNEIIGCAHAGKCNEQCTTAFRIVPAELQFYRQMNLPLPRLCPNCRHYERLSDRNPVALTHASCACAGRQSKNGIYKNGSTHFHGENYCPNKFETPFSSERPEFVYCEQCYQAEVV